VVLYWCGVEYRTFIKVDSSLHIEVGNMVKLQKNRSESNSLYMPIPTWVHNIIDMDKWLQFGTNGSVVYFDFNMSLDNPIASTTLYNRNSGNYSATIPIEIVHELDLKPNIDYSIEHVDGSTFKLVVDNNE
jgi:hypothetical protein